MNKIFLIAFLFFFISCQKEFNSPEQAKNEVTINGLKDGRWVEYILYEGKGFVNDSLSEAKIAGYRLINYEKGYPMGKIKEFYKNGDTRTYSISLNKPATKHLFPKETYVDSIFYTSENYNRVTLNKDKTTYVKEVFKDYNNKKNKEIKRLLLRDIPVDRKNLIEKIEWEYLPDADYKIYLNLKEEGILRAKSYLAINYLESGQNDTIYLDNYMYKLLNKRWGVDDYLIYLKIKSIKERIDLKGRLARCICCKSPYYWQEGWDYSYGKASSWTSFSAFLRFGGGWCFCSLKCASQCGPHYQCDDFFSVDFIETLPYFTKIEQSWEYLKDPSSEMTPTRLLEWVNSQNGRGKNDLDRTREATQHVTTTQSSTTTFNPEIPKDLLSIVTPEQRRLIFSTYKNGKPYFYYGYYWYNEEIKKSRSGVWAKYYPEFDKWYEVTKDWPKVD